MDKNYGVCDGIVTQVLYHTGTGKAISEREAFELLNEKDRIITALSETLRSTSCYDSIDEEWQSQWSDEDIEAIIKKAKETS